MPALCVDESVAVLIGAHWVVLSACDDPRRSVSPGAPPGDVVPEVLFAHGMSETRALCLFPHLARTCYFAVGGNVRVRTPPQGTLCLTNRVHSAAALSWVSTRGMELSVRTDVLGYVGV